MTTTTEATGAMTLALHVNGRAVEVEVSPWKRLLDVLREDLRLTGTKEGCGEGECGACTVMIDGEAVNSCLVAAAQAVGHEVLTIEGLAATGGGGGAGGGEGGGQGALHAVQAALVKFGGTQCGICTPGIAMCAARVIEREPDASRARLRELMAGNICRCTGYQLIVDAVAEVAAQRRQGSGS
ncbi:MAG TPA: (2Fe-2S)-binding protein [Kofleriaceae bacterium]|nr:(2Fe-2S)-binding protein [Kofleriaceae bacterium]